MIPMEDLKVYLRLKFCINLIIWCSINSSDQHFYESPTIEV